jgi:hypothetical protein
MQLDEVEEFSKLVGTYKHSMTLEEIDYNACMLNSWIQTSSSTKDSLLEWQAYWHFRVH